MRRWDLHTSLIGNSTPVTVPIQVKLQDKIQQFFSDQLFLGNLKREKGLNRHAYMAIYS